MKFKGVAHPMIEPHLPSEGSAVQFFCSCCNGYFTENSQKT